MWKRNNHTPDNTRAQENIGSASSRGSQDNQTTKSKLPPRMDAAQIAKLRRRSVFHLNRTCTIYTEDRWAHAISPCGMCRRSAWALIKFHLTGKESPGLDARRESRSVESLRPTQRPKPTPTSSQTSSPRESITFADAIDLEHQYHCNSSGETMELGVIDAWDHTVARLEQIDWDNERERKEGERILEHLESRVPKATVAFDLRGQ